MKGFLVTDGTHAASLKLHKLIEDVLNDYRYWVCRVCGVKVTINTERCPACKTEDLSQGTGEVTE